MLRRWKVAIEKTFSPDHKDPQLYELRLERLTEAQLSFLRTFLEADMEVDPIGDWGFAKEDGDLQAFRMNVSIEIQKKGF